MFDRISEWRFRRRLAALGESRHDLLRDYCEANWTSVHIPLHEAALVALDFELDGLGRDAHVLQVGWVGFNSGGISLAEAESLDIRSVRRLDDGAVAVHGIVEERAREGHPLQEVLERLIPTLAGRVLVAHGAAIEAEVLARTSRACFGQKIPLRTICTLQLERKINPNLVGGDCYQLAATRARYNLPPYPQHDALSDALGAAELLLAQAKTLPTDVRLAAVLGQ